VGAVAGQAAGALAGSSLGGGAGEGARQLIGQLMGVQAPADPMGEISNQMKLQPMYATAGELANPLVKTGAKWVMQLALKAGPEVAQTALDNGISATTGGLKRLRMLGQQAAGKVQSVVNAMKATGGTVNRDALADETAAKVEEIIGKQGITDADRASLNKLVERFKTDSKNPVDLPMDRVQQVKQSADQLATRLHESIKAGGYSSVSDPVEQLWHKAQADLLREKMGSGSLGKYYQAANADHAKLIQLADAIDPSIAHEMSAGAKVLGAAMHPATRFTTGAAIGAAMPANSPVSRSEHALLTALLVAGGGSPASLSLIARAINSAPAAALTQAAVRSPMLAQERR